MHDVRYQPRHPLFPPPALSAGKSREPREVDPEPLRDSRAYISGFDEGLSLDPGDQSNYICGLVAGMIIRVKADLSFQTVDEVHE